MGILENVREEFKRTPVTVIATVSGVAVAVLALFVAWLQFNSQPSIAIGAPTAKVTAGEMNFSNLLLVFAVFLASSFSLASTIRILDRKFPFPAMVLSVPAAVLAGFLSLLAFKFAPPRQISAEQFQLTVDIAFWGTFFVFVAINGGPIAKSVATPNKSEPKSDQAGKNNGQKSDASGEMVGLLLLALIWGGLVMTGVSKLANLLLV